MATNKSDIIPENIEFKSSLEESCSEPGPEKPADLCDRVEQLNEIGKSLSAERDSNRLLERILIGAKRITHADGGTLYLLDFEKQELHFEIMRTDSMNIASGGTTKKPINLPPIPLFNGDGQANLKSVATYAAITGNTVNISDAYETDADFDFTGTKRYDQETGYHSKSFLTIPMKNHENEIIGVLQLINSIDPTTKETRSFSQADQRLAESLASQAAVAMTNQQLIFDLRRLMEKFIEVIAGAIDEKSPYTGSHCRRVPEIAMLIADAINEVESGPYAGQVFNSQELYELRIAALLHDCGKIITPVHVIDKATKLEAIFDRIQLVDSRFEILRRDLEIELLKKKMALQHPADSESIENLEQEYEDKVKLLTEQQEFLHQANIGREFMNQDDQQKVVEIATNKWLSIGGEATPLLDDEMIYNLQITKGTLTAEERKVINNHIVATINMLERLPFPKSLANVPEIAGGHHERMDGKGYPRGLTREQMSVQARLMGIADIFEALTATDRPYKQPMKLSQTLNILGNMALEGHIDPDIFQVFVSQRVYLKYAEKFLDHTQIDEIDLSKVPGYNTAH